MSSIEERLARDIADVTKGIVVTEPELLEARSALDERIDGTRRRDRRRTLALVAAAAVVVAGAGVAAFQVLGTDEGTVVPAGPGPTVDDAYADFLTGALPTPELVNGIWRVDNGDVMVQFHEDGTVQFDDDGTLISGPLMEGTYRIDGELITVTPSQDAGCVGSEFTMRASLPSPGAMRVVLADPSFGDCLAAPIPLVLEHVLPTARGMKGWGPTGEGGWQPLSDKQAAWGDWMATGGGHLLEIGPSGSYYVFDESAEPVDQGRWSRRGSDLVLTSSADSAECSEGDQLVLGAVELTDSVGPFIRGTVEQNNCGGDWAPKTWVLIPNAGS